MVGEPPAECCKNPNTLMNEAMSNLLVDILPRLAYCGPISPFQQMFQVLHVLF